MEEEEEVVVVEMEMEMEMEVVAEATKITRKCSQKMLSMILYVVMTVTAGDRLLVNFMDSSIY